jgi:hypothetical protein
LPPSAVVGGVLETGPSPSGYHSRFSIFDTLGFPKDRVPGSDIYLRLSETQIPIFESVTHGSQFCLKIFS